MAQRVALFVTIYRQTPLFLFFFGCSEVNSTWLIASQLANQHERKVLFTCVAYTETIIHLSVGESDVYLPPLR